MFYSEQRKHTLAPHVIMLVLHPQVWTEVCTGRTKVQKPSTLTQKPRERRANTRIMATPKNFSVGIFRDVQMFCDHIKRMDFYLKQSMNRNKFGRGGGCDFQNKNKWSMQDLKSRIKLWRLISMMEDNVCLKRYTKGRVIYKSLKW